MLSLKRFFYISHFKFMIFSKLKYISYGIGISLVTTTLVSNASWLNGIFGDYFANMTLACSSNNVVTWFDASGPNFGLRHCSTLQSILGNIFGASTAPTGQAMVGFDASGNPKYGSVNWNNNGANISYTGANVGIGTNTPSAKLEVNGTMKATNVIYGDNTTKTTTVNNINNPLSSGFYNSNNATWEPYASWWHIITNRHVNEWNQYEFQMTSDFWQGWRNSYLRTIENGIAQPWRQFITAETNSKVSIWSTSQDYLPGSYNWNYTLQLNAQDTSSIGFHDAGNNVGSIRFKNNLFTIGANDGWGIANTFINGSLWIGTHGPESSNWWMSIHKDDWAIVTRKADGGDNVEPQNPRWSIYTNDIYLRSSGKWLSSISSSTSSCYIITPANATACHNELILTRATGYAWHGFNLRDTWPYYGGGTCNLDGVTLHHPGYRYAWPAWAAIILKNVSGRLWAYGKNFPTNIWDAGGWWLWHSGSADFPICDLSDTLSCQGGIFWPQYNQITITANTTWITTGCTAYGNNIPHAFDF